MWVGSAFGKFSEKRFRDRVRFVSVVFIVAYLIIVLRLFHLQVVRGEAFTQMSESNRTQVIFLRAPRGNFYDRNGELLVTNRPSWSLLYSVPKESSMSLREVEERVAPFLKTFDDRWKKKLIRAFQTKQMVRLVENVPNQVAFGMREMGSLLPGTRMEMEFRRYYENTDFIGHLVGYLGEIDDNELEEGVWGLRKPGDLIGKMGLEKILDDKLRGQDGGMVVEVDSVGRLKRIIRELPYHAGSAVTLTIDSKIQRAALEGLSKTITKRGAAVALDVRTGAILAWVSAPALDTARSFGDQINDPNRPFFDRVYKGNYPPGSIFKIITAIAGFEKGVINTKEEVNCVGYIGLMDKQQQERRYGCWKVHGRVDFWRAVAESCDSYFYLLGQKVGSQAIYEMARQFGMGEYVQDVFPGEKKGQVLNSITKKKSGLGGWSVGDTLNMSIGQGFMTTSPLQMAVLMAGVASKGQFYKPYVVAKIGSQDEKEKITSQTLRRSIVLKDSTWEKIHRALRLVVAGGTGQVANIPYLEVYGKTGTAQNPHGEDHAWFGAFAGYPGEELQIAVCVFVENGGKGSGVAGPIARRMLEIALPPRTPKPVS